MARTASLTFGVPVHTYKDVGHSTTRASMAVASVQRTNAVLTSMPRSHVTHYCGAGGQRAEAAALLHPCRFVPKARHLAVISVRARNYPQRPICSGPRNGCEVYVNDRCRELHNCQTVRRVEEDIRGAFRHICIPAPSHGTSGHGSKQ